MSKDKEDVDKRQRKFKEAQRSRVARMAGNIASGFKAGGAANEALIAERAVGIARQIDNLVYNESEERKVSSTLDWRDVLTNYMGMIVEIRGCHYVKDRNRTDGFTNREWVALLEVAKEHPDALK